jgi:hypothetical protein
MDEETGSWSHESVHAFFEPDIADQIMQVPISKHAGQDFVCWPHTRHGTFTVRSAYNLARSKKFFGNLSRSGRGLSSSWEADEKAWNALWKIKAPGKMNIHLWCFSHDCLPSGIQLCKRQIPADGTCIFCRRAESIGHAMLFCQFARSVWREVKKFVPLKLNRKEFFSNKQWLFDFLSRSNDLQTTTLAVGFYLIWETRNEARNSDVKANPVRTGGKIVAYVDMIKQHLFKTGTEHRCVCVHCGNKYMVTTVVGNSSYQFRCCRL